MTISIVIPAYNVEDCIQRCIESIVEQTYKNIEIILIDDGSEDNTGIICDIYADKDARIKVVHKSNTGVSDSRNEGVFRSNGDYVCFVDADDWIEKDYIEKAVNELRNNYSILFNSWVKDTDGKIDFLYEISDKCLMDKQSAVRELCVQKKFGWAPFAAFYRKDLAQKCEFPIDICFGEDFLYKYQCIKMSDSPIAYIAMNKYHYVCHSSSATKSYSILRKRDDLKVIKFIMDEEGGRIKDILYYKEYLPRMINYALIGCASKERKEREQGETYRAELLANTINIFFLGKLNLNAKIKFLMLLLPYNVRKELGIKYKEMKGFL